MSIRVRRKAFRAIILLACSRGLSLSSKNLIFDVNCGLFMRLHSTIGCSNRRRTSRCRHGFQFSGIQILLLIISIDAPESTTNSLSSGLRFDGAGRHLFSEGEKNAALVLSFNFWMLLARLHAASRAPRSCHSVSS